MISKKVLLFIFISLLSSLYAADDEMSITVKEAQLRSKPSFLGKIVYRLHYSDRVTVLEKKNGWVLIEYSENYQSGWLHSSALVKEEITLKATNADLDRNASSSEVALAGKGFNSQVEEEYKSLNNLDYTWVDRMELLSIDPEDALNFLKSGNITPEESGE